MPDDMMQDALDKGLISFAKMQTQPLVTDRNWWNVRAWVIATDRDLQAAELPMPERLRLRRN